LPKKKSNVNEELGIAKSLPFGKKSYLPIPFLDDFF
jgi:hypothetical protein